MQRTESVSSITSLMIGVRLDEERPLEEENHRLRDIVHEQTAEIRDLKFEAEKNKMDAALWAYAKKRYCKQLGFETGKELELKVKADMRKENELKKSSTAGA